MTSETSKLKRMYNLTLHDNAGDEDTFKEYNFNIDPKPRLMSPPRGNRPDNPEDVIKYAKYSVEEIPDDADAVLIGGLTDLMIYIYMLLKRKRPDVEIWVAATKRVGNQYEVAGLRRVSKMEEAGR